MNGYRMGRNLYLLLTDSPFSSFHPYNSLRIYNTPLYPCTEKTSPTQLWKHNNKESLPSGFIQTTGKSDFYNIKMNLTFGNSQKNAYLCIAFEKEVFSKRVWRDGRVVDYSSLENCRAERHRGFESLSLRNKR